ncbi:MAG: hypothetical protein PHR06_11605 [Candidatus Cloacimonetes bacterium]|nr:hypothetical protein [Candidatus Cloacimonadota bacterium]
MNKKITFLILITVMTIQLFSVSQFACSFLFINTSARDAAFGVESGVAGLRNLSPSTFNNNPAKLGAFSGIGVEDFTYTYGYAKIASRTLALGWNGIGVSLPIKNSKSSWNTYIDYGSQIETDEQGEVIGSFDIIESNEQISVGVDLFQVANHITRNENLKEIQETVKVYLGYSHNSVKSLIDVDSDQIENKIDGKANFTNYGLLLQYKLNHLPNYGNGDITFGVNLFNVGKEKIAYVDPAQADYLPYGTKYAVSACYSRDIEWFYNIYPEAKNSFLRKFLQESFALFLSSDLADYGYSRDIFGCGGEISLLNLLSYRIGYTNNSDTESDGLSYSFGLRLEYDNLISLAYDYTNMFNSSDVYIPEKQNFMLRVKF